jgi:hypothetical protein
LPETLPEIEPEVEAVPLVPPVVVLTLTLFELTLVPVVVTSADVRTDVEQAPLQPALARESDVLPDSVTVLLA